MSVKLTLSVDQALIKKAKEFAKKNNTSLSQLFESYLSSLTKKEKNTDPEISPLVKSLSGVLKLPENFDHKKDRAKYLENKYK